jgi:putative intracellular protease/amidase
MRFRSIAFRSLRLAALAALALTSTSGMASPSATELARLGKVDHYEARFGRTRPVIAVIGENAGTELIDFTVPYGVLSASGAADVLAVSTHSGPLHMLPALTFQTSETLDTFDARYPEAADYVVVPAMRFANEADGRRVISWLQAQASRGATVVSICDGALIVAKAGLFYRRAATRHWASRPARQRASANTLWLDNIRYVADGKVVSSAGVTAALPTSLALVEAIAGRDRAATLAAELGVYDWSNTHDSSNFRLTKGVYFLAVRNWVLRNQMIELPVNDGVDDIALALTADAYSRTFRSKAYATSSTSDAVKTRHGLTLLPDRKSGRSRDWRPVDLMASGGPPGKFLDAALDSIGQKFGQRTSNFVALQLEYAQ